MSEALRSPTRWRVLEAEGRPAGSRIHFPADDAVLARLVAGESIPLALRGAMRSYAPGEVAVGLPAVSVAGLLAAGRIAEAGGPDDPFAGASADSSAPAAQGVRAPGAPAAQGVRAPAEPDATEAARALADEEGLDLSAIDGTGKGGRVTLPDVESYLEAQAAEVRGRASDPGADAGEGGDA